MEDWLFKADNYEPRKDRDSFLEKSILNILEIVDYIKKSSEIANRSYINMINPLLKFIFTLTNLIFISLTKSWGFTLIIMFFIILMIINITKKERVRFIISTIPITIIPLIMVFPAVVMDKKNVSLKILMKIVESIFLSRILAVTTESCQLTLCLKKLHVPDMFIFVMDLTLKYIFILGEFSLNMLYALKIKAIGRNYNRYSSMWSLIGNLFFKSKHMADEMFLAMECKAFNGEYIIYNKIEILKRKDLLFIIINLVLFILFLILK